MFRVLSQWLLGGIFLKCGADAYARPGQAEGIAGAGLPNPGGAVELRSVAMVMGGAMLALNVAPRLAAAALIGSLVPMTLVSHAFWKEEDKVVRDAQYTQFLKNLGLIGGLLLLLTQKKE